MTTITIRTENGKIYASPDARIGKELFSAFRGNGWLWSGRYSAFCFNDNTGGAQRVRALFSGAWLNRYGISDETKQEGAGLIFEYADEQVRAHFEQANADAKAKAEAEKAEKERKAEQTTANKVAQLQKILDATRDMPNGWQSKITRGYGYPITTTAEFFECGGLVMCESVKTLAEQYSLTIPDDMVIDDDDLLQLNINYDFCKEGYNYWNGKQTPERRDMVLSVEYYRRGKNNSMTASSGNFRAKIILAHDLKQRTLAGYKQYAEMCGDDVKRIAVQLYINYCLQNDSKAISAHMFARVAGNGTATLDELRAIYAT